MRMRLILLLSLLIYTLVIGEEYKFKLSDIDHFVEDNNGHNILDNPESRIGLMEQSQLQELCRGAAKTSINDYHYYIETLDGKLVNLVTLARSFKTIFGEKNDFVTACRCPSEPVIYLIDGRWKQKILFMITGYREGDRTKIHGLHLSQWKEYWDHVKKQLHKGDKNGNKGPKEVCTREDKEKLKEHISSFLEKKKKRKGHKKHHYGFGEENEGEENEGGSSSGENENPEEPAADDGGVAEALGGEEVAGTLSEAEVAVMEGCGFGALFSEFIEAIKGIELPNIEIPEFQLPDFQLPEIQLPEIEINF